MRALSLSSRGDFHEKIDAVIHLESFQEDRLLRLARNDDTNTESYNSFRFCSTSFITFSASAMIALPSAVLESARNLIS